MLTMLFVFLAICPGNPPFHSSKRICSVHKHREVEKMEASSSNDVPAGDSAYESSQAFSTLLAKTVVDATNTYGVRSSKRTDAIHMFIKLYIESRNPNVTCVVEYSLKTGLGIFKVDVAVFHKTTHELLACLLFKGLTSSISKNDKNYAHHKLG